MGMRSAIVAAVAFGLAGCGSAALRAAEAGDHGKLRSEIASKHVRGKLTNDEAADLARAVAEREITSAKDEATALQRLRETRACAADLDDALSKRMKTRDAAGAEAALSRLEDGNLSDGAVRELLGEADDRWRAVGTRTLHRDEDRKKRQDAFLDPSPRVRRSAIRASVKAKDPTDLDLLIEVARVDPELLLRNEALRASSAIVRGLRDSDRGAASKTLALRLRDLWTTGDDAIREDVAVAWALTPVWENGGREALRVTIGDGKGPGAIAAAGVVARSREDDGELAGSARAVLARTIEDGSYRERLHAMAIARLDAGPLLEAIRKAAKDEDRDVRIAALSRLLESKSDRDVAIRELTKIASHGVKGGAPARQDDGRARVLASRARYALASAGDLRVQAWIEEDLTAPDPNRKAEAASALAAMGRSARAAPLLADPDPAVRTRAACTMILAARR
jgi:hypothetical protein